MEIGKLTSLRMLFLQGNTLPTLPYSMQHLLKLWWLDVSNNSMQALPVGLKALPLTTFVSKGNPCGAKLAVSSRLLPVGCFVAAPLLMRRMAESPNCVFGEGLAKDHRLLRS